MRQSKAIAAIKEGLTSLRLRILLPVIVITVSVVTLLNTLYSRAYINMIMQQEQEVNAVSFETVTNSVVPRINESITGVRRIVQDSRVASCARYQISSESELIHERMSCRDYLRSEITTNDQVFGLLFMREDGSIFGTLPVANLFADGPQDNPLPEDMKARILSVPLGQTIWVGPIREADICGFELSSISQTVMIAAWKSVNVNYGECYVMMLG